MDFMIVVMLGILGAALIAGGIVAYRGSVSVGVRALSTAAVAAGAIMWIFILASRPVSVNHGPSPTAAPPRPMRTLVAIPTATFTATAQSTSPDLAYQECPNLLVSVRAAQEEAVVTSCQHRDIHVDFTGRYPSTSPSLVIPRDDVLNFRLEAEHEPTMLEGRVYPGAGISAAFFKWPEQLPIAITPVDRLHPVPSLTFQYLPDKPPGEYSLVIRAVWEGSIDVFYAISFTLQ